jgi:hypothetical protein
MGFRDHVDKQNRARDLRAQGWTLTEISEKVGWFWSELTAIPLPQFRKPYRAVPDPSIRNSKHPMGCGTVAYSSTQVHREIMGMVDALLSSVVSIGAVDRCPSPGEIDPG